MTWAMPDLQLVLDARSSVVAVVEDKVVSPGSWAFPERRKHVVSVCFRTGGREADSSLIKILIPPLPTSLPSQQPTLLFGVLVILLG